MDYSEYIAFCSAVLFIYGTIWYTAGLRAGVRKARKLAALPVIDEDAAVEQLERDMAAKYEITVIERPMGRPANTLH